MKRAFVEHTWKEIEALPKDPGVVVLPIGAIEQHGPHLPLCTDAKLAEATVQRAFEALPAEVAAWYLPVQSYGKSNEHTGYPGTLALSASTLMGVVRDIAVSLHRAGFRRLMLFNAHGGNKALLEMMCRDLRAELGLLCFLVQGQVDASRLPPSEQRFGIHAGTLETALMLHLTPGLVRQPLPPARYPRFDSQNFNLTLLPQVAWLTRDWSPEGHFGNPQAAVAEAGQAWFEEMAHRLAELIAEASTFEVAYG
ncbi:creatininase family protein [Meiothermus granaticius]|uniref:Creatinine amidohydrolase n=1 Tax=Meiothermus granaticius NBRC 107808 TaxID=1227551 RepID=A0A399FCV8_9DEIN|nr:creatininase family protein [Meiothermus granaticius]RIH93565.1 Creatinine amidohydrolase [Meiothermus granaticius NBRC 107808]GEM87203.1 creatinine amidohydrolase [Meiothermus granaticius NBRC 107808]